MKGTIYRFIKNGNYRLFYVLPNGKATEYTNTGVQNKEVLFNPIYHSLKQDGWVGEII